MQNTLDIEREMKSKCLELNAQGDVSFEQRNMFDIMFVHNDEDQTVEVVESSTIDFNAIIEHLRDGNSIFIAPKKQGPPQRTMNRKRPTYINHI